MMRNDETTTGAVIPAEILERLEAELKNKPDYTVMDAAIMAYYPRLSGAAIARAIGATNDRNVQVRIVRLKREKKI